MKTLLIVYHSLTGGTRQMAEAAAAGAAAESGVAVRLLQAAAAGPGDVLADGYIFAAPENLAALAGLMKDFLAPYGLLICAGSELRERLRRMAQQDGPPSKPRKPRP